MALYRAFSVGHFKCSGASPIIKTALEGLPNGGYELVIRKKTTRPFCLHCIKNFFARKSALRLTENKDYLKISSP